MLLAQGAVLSANALATDTTNIPHTFSAGQPARAYQVNENFDAINEKAKENLALITALEAQITKMEESQSLFKESIEVDCSDDPAALAKAYWEIKDSAITSFFVSGTCYGDIRNHPETGEFYQAHQQTLFILGNEEVGAKLIPNPQTKNTGMWGGFNGGLYIHDLTVDLGTGAGFGFSRNSQGSIHDVTIIGSGNYEDEQRAFYIQASAQVYLGGVSIQNVNHGIHANGGSAVRVLGSQKSDIGLEIKNSQNGIALNSNAVLRQSGPISIDAEEPPIAINSANWALHWGASEIKGGEVLVENAYSFTTDNAVFDVENVRVERSQFTVGYDSSFDISKLSCEGLSQVNIDGVTDLLSQVPDSNCLDNASMSRLIQLIK